MILMCGIAGIWGKVKEKELKHMIDSLIHRGPDEEGMYISEESGILGHRRLSIMDPAGGDQPIFSEDGSKAVIANGEIYNFPQLLPELSQRHFFRTNSDSEAIVHLYEDSSSAVVEQLDGMYAFAIADGGELFAARDPIGIKPLYYAQEDDAFLFASELKALSFCQDIREFPPGTVFHSETGFRTFYRLPENLPREAPIDDHVRRLKKTLEQAVGKRLMSDVPLGCFLSGGLDSSIIAALARKHMDELHTFSVGIEGSRDLEAARLVARHLDTIHHEHIITAKEVVKNLSRIIYFLESFDQDLVRSAIPCYFTSRLASDYVKVILTGEGADELFAGYTYYKDITDSQALHSELHRSVGSLHNINLQRVDRMTMAHSVEGRVPFLDLRMIQVALLIPTKLKLAGSPPIEKWILRKTFEGLLPDEVVWRDKEQFDEGSGTVDLLTGVMAKELDETEALAYRRRFPGIMLRAPEECHYHRLFSDVFENPEQLLSNVGRWANRPSFRRN